MKTITSNLSPAQVRALEKLIAAIATDAHAARLADAGTYHKGTKAKG